MIYIKSCDQVRLAVYDYNPSGTETVVMVHGWPLSHEIFHCQVELLVNCGYRVVTMDLRGFGMSDAPASGYCYDQFASDLSQIVRELELCSFTLVGFSMGGAVVLRYMNRYQGCGVKKLVLLAAAAPRYTRACDFPCGVTKESVDALVKQACADRTQLSEEFSRKLLYSPHSEAVKNWFRDISLCASQVGTVSSACALRDEDGRADLACVHVPTGIFQGIHDEIVPPELAGVQHQAIKNSSLFWFGNSGHAVFYDEMTAFNRYFLDFIRLPESGCCC